MAMETIKNRVKDIEDQIRTIEVLDLWDVSEKRLDNLMAEMERLKEQLDK